jgi:hypothetical protein
MLPEILGKHLTRSVIQTQRLEPDIYHIFDYKEITTITKWKGSMERLEIERKL